MRVKKYVLQFITMLDEINNRKFRKLMYTLVLSSDIFFKFLSISKWVEIYECVCDKKSRALPVNLSAKDVGELVRVDSGSNGGGGGTCWASERQGRRQSIRSGRSRKRPRHFSELRRPRRMSVGQNAPTCSWRRLTRRRQRVPPRRPFSWCRLPPLCCGFSLDCQSPVAGRRRPPQTSAPKHQNNRHRLPAPAAPPFCSAAERPNLKFESLSAPLLNFHKTHPDTYINTREYILK